MNRYLMPEIRRSLRDARYLVLAVVMPVGFYLLFTNLFGSHGEQVQGLPQPVELMTAMAAYGGMWAVFSATGPRIAQEREQGWLRQLRLTPLSARRDRRQGRRRHDRGAARDAAGLPSPRCWCTACACRSASGSRSSPAGGWRRCRWRCSASRSAITCPATLTTAW